MDFIKKMNDWPLWAKLARTIFWLILVVLRLETK